MWSRRKHGDEYPEWLKVRAVTDKRGNITHFINLFTDISAQKPVSAICVVSAMKTLLLDCPIVGACMTCLPRGCAICALVRVWIWRWWISMA